MSARLKNPQLHLCPTLQQPLLDFSFLAKIPQATETKLKSARLMYFQTSSIGAGALPAIKRAKRAIS